MNNYHTVQLTGAAQAAYIAQRFNQPEPAAGIVNTVDLYEFRRAFTDYNRANNFSYEGLTALFDWLEQLAEDTGVPYELDVIALCCEFTEYENLQEIQENYSSTKLDNIDDLQDHTAVIEFDGGLIIQDF